MTHYHLHLKAKDELTPHATVQYWRKCQVEELFNMPFMDLVFKAAQVHRENFNPNEIQLSTLLSIKTGGCPEECDYCPQSARHDTGVQKQAILDVDYIVEKAKIAKARGASRFVWRRHGVGQNQRIWHYFLTLSKPSKIKGLKLVVPLGCLKKAWRRI